VSRIILLTVSMSFVFYSLERSEVSSIMIFTFFMNLSNLEKMCYLYISNSITSCSFDFKVVKEGLFMKETCLKRGCIFFS
jgi:hypothetical protein